MDAEKLARSAIAGGAAARAPSRAASTTGMRALRTPQTVARAPCGQLGESLVPASRTPRFVAARRRRHAPVGRGVQQDELVGLVARHAPSGEGGAIRRA